MEQAAYEEFKTPWQSSLVRDGETRAIKTLSQNFLLIMKEDEFYHDIRMNLLTGRPEVKRDGRWRAWSNADMSTSRCYMESKYGIHSKQKHDDAFLCMVTSRPHHPIKEIVESIQWDGSDRIESFLTKWLKCEDNPYTREVSRLIFAGGINRLYRPGCKFDDMPVLVGSQGCGKSTAVRWLAMDDKFFREVNEFDGQKGMEAIEGAWICEVSELLAMTKVREQEAVKSYLTRLVDSYRRPYDPFITDHPRECVFIGTTNKQQFLADKTGGRRFYPVLCQSDGYELNDAREECQEYIRQCWAEALAKRETGFMAPYADRSVLVEVREAQDYATEDDIRVGMIESYIADRDEVCGLELWRNALGVEIKLPEKRDSMEIGLIMQAMPNWERVNSKKNFGDFGRQKYWRRRKIMEMKAVESYDNPFETAQTSLPG